MTISYEVTAANILQYMLTTRVNEDVGIVTKAALPYHSAVIFVEGELFLSSDRKVLRPVQFDIDNRRPFEKEKDLALVGNALGEEYPTSLIYTKYIYIYDNSPKRTVYTKIYVDSML